MATVLMLSSLGLAAHETSQLGPYTASFDMNTNLKYQVQQIANPISTPISTVYGARIFTDNATWAQIAITEYKNFTDSTPDMWKQLIFFDLAFVGFNATKPNDVSIDGKNGFEYSATSMQGNNMLPTGAKLFRTIYWLDSKNCECGPVSVGTANVDITSTYPQDVTQGLLNSLHVVKGTAPAK